MIYTEFESVLNFTPEPFKGDLKMWYFEEDDTNPIITGKKQAQSNHGNIKLNHLPTTALLLYMRGLESIKEKYKLELISEEFPRFLNSCPIYKAPENEICLLDGGRGAPMAVDTIEVLKAYGVETIISIGLMGSIAEEIDVGDIVIPSKAYVEEGTSLHYYKRIEYSTPDLELLNIISEKSSNSIIRPIITTDSIYRQTYYKEKLWRDKGCVGIDMETSALMSVGKYLNMNVCSALMVSDKHPIDKFQKSWGWKLTESKRQEFLENMLDIVLSI